MNKELVHLKWTLFSLKDLAAQIREGHFYDYIYQFIDLSNSVYGALQAIRISNPELKRVIEDYPFLEKRQFNNHFLNLIDYIYRKMPFYSFRTAEEMLNLNIYPQKRAYQVELIPQIDKIVGIADTLLSSTGESINNE